ncbi:DUF4291 domain-containing protein [Marinactinospora thermotolerans]|uniref:DUF4291 domain-containing protein n=1 Tax=Marinactinospora thermotolerans DSM 45154 TaxID=1122192 RepID=A0A1T4SN11_9ACTN|nr:DUF4291 domain-containing protein [Marinactinospora thermotolerans]SKA29298.1 protein of unknown function [Marinactinospora thermotolerans DSM 45154]
MRATPSRVPAAREVRADHDDTTLVVYQAYPAPIADAALAAGTFVPPFKHERMTWIKPSFLWMMYRCGYAAKPGQERVLAVRIRREGFEWALRHSCPSHFDRALHDTHEEWRAALGRSPVRVQWDPERDVRGAPLAHRSIQVGLSGEAVRRYTGEWITGIADVTARALRMRELLDAGRSEQALALLPDERVLPLSPEAAAAVRASAADA